MIPAPRAVFSFRSRAGRRQPGLSGATWRLESLRSELPKPTKGLSGRIPLMPNSKVRLRFAKQAREVLARLQEPNLDSHVLDVTALPNIEHGEIRMLSAARPLHRTAKSVSAAIHFEDRIYQLTLSTSLQLTVRPWVVAGKASGFFEGDFTTMDVNWFLFMRPGIDIVEIDVARLLPVGIPLELPDWQLALWLKGFFGDDVNPGLPLPYDLNLAQQPIDDDLPREVQEAVSDALLIERESGLTNALIRLPSGPFGMARFHRPEDPALDQKAIARLSILINMIVEDVPTNVSWPDAPYHPDLRPRFFGPHTVARAAPMKGVACGHDSFEAMTRLMPIYRRKRNTWLARWSQSGPDGIPVSPEAVSELDALFGMPV